MIASTQLQNPPPDERDPCDIPASEAKLFDLYAPAVLGGLLASTDCDGVIDSEHAAIVVDQVSEIVGRMLARRREFLEPAE